MEHGTNRIIRPLTAPVTRSRSKQNCSSKQNHKKRARPVTAKELTHLPAPTPPTYIETLFETSDRLILGKPKEIKDESERLRLLRTTKCESISTAYDQIDPSPQEQLPNRPTQSQYDRPSDNEENTHDNILNRTNDKLKKDLHRRITARKNIGITSDVIFQMQTKSSFWTSDTLYHNWGNHLLELRERNCHISSGSFGENTSGGTEEENLPTSIGSLSSAFNGDMIPTRKPSRTLQHRTSDPDIEEDPILRKNRLRETFKRAIRIIRVVSLIASCMLRSSKDSTTETFVAQLHYMTSGDKENLAFNKNKFLKDNSLHVPSWLPQIADTLPKDRTPEAIYKIYGVMNDMKSFERFSNKVRLELCRVARYMSCGKGRVIVRQGHVGFGFYFIYSGSVFVQLDIVDQTGIVMTQTVNVIGKGACFGELALLGDGRRTASIICREPTELFEIEKDTFLESCPYIYEEELSEKIEITLKYEFFRKWPKSSLHRLCFESQIREVAYGRIVDRDTVATDYLYFVLKGKLVMLKELDLSMFARGNSRLYLNNCSDRLPTPRPRTTPIGGKTRTFPHATKSNKCYIKIGDIQDGESTEMTSVKQTDDGKHKPTGVILVSNGVRLMCMSKRKLQDYAPKQLLDDFSRNDEPVSRIPTDEELYMKYLADINWQTFKSDVVDTLHDEKSGKSILSRPATAKGASAWSRWPGNKIQATSTKFIRSKTESYLPSRCQWQPK